MKCSQCNVLVEEADQRAHQGQILCEDCYMEALSSLKTCDPWAAYNAQRHEVNQKEPPKLSPLQDRILKLITAAGEIEVEALLGKLGGEITHSELERQFATLRHMGKAGARKSGGKIFFVAG